MLSFTEICLFIFVFTLTVFGFMKPIYFRYQLIRLGKLEDRYNSPLKRIKDAFISFFFLKCSVKKERIFTGVIHFFILYGALIFDTVTVNHILEGFKEDFYLFGYGTLGFIHSLLVDIFALLVILGVLYFIVRRYVFKPKALTYPSFESAVIYFFLLTVTLTFLFYEGAETALHSFNNRGAFLGEIVAPWVLKIVPAGWSPELMVRISWWLHILIVFGFVVYVPRSKYFHILTGPINIAFQNYQPKGIIKPIDIEKSEVFGVEKFTDFTWKDLLDGFACVDCGRCEDYCPASQSEKPLSPKNLILHLKDGLLKEGSLLLTNQETQLNPLMNNIFFEDEIWTCTTCGACMQVCPVKNEHIPKIIGLRQSQVLMEGKFPSELNQFFRNIETNSNPWGIGSATRADWAEELELKTLVQNSNVELLYWVGCAGSFDDRGKKVSSALVKILKEAKINFGILGQEEKCCGDQARRLGNEYLFQTLAMENIKIFQKYNIKKIVVTCPHGYNTFRNEYPQLAELLGDNQWKVEVLHHSQLIFELIKQGKIKLNKKIESLTFHDPCYLGRHNVIFDLPRKILSSSSRKFIEIKNHREHSFCCGAGGGLMWTEEKLGQRINHLRIEEAINTHAQIISTACPFCLTMLEDGLKDKGKEEEIKVKDIAEIVAECL
ncbi:MAG: heterodisulfide reductase-related iron-sulfur binding cluster [Candidatus Aminicenantia bacterium]